MSPLRAHLTPPVVALLCACGLSMAALGTRIVLSGELRPLYLAWNLFLALLPLLFAISFCRSVERGDRPLARLVLFATWLAFLPNAPYILTDFVHLKAHSHPRFWSDLGLLLLFSWSGAFAGFLSLFLVQRSISRRHGVMAGWLLVLIVAALSGVGVYLGRFERWNTWDLLLHPWAVLRDASNLCFGALGHRPFRIAALFGTVIFIGYMTLYSLVLPQQIRAGQRG